jgi:MFS family permease
LHGSHAAIRRGAWPHPGYDPPWAIEVARAMNRSSTGLTLGFAGVAHVYAHMFMLLYATIVLALEREWAMSYAELFALSIPGAIMFGAAALPAGWLGDRWSASGMMAVYFLGLGLAVMATGFARTPFELGCGLTAIGVFAAIYHPVGIPWLIGHAVNRGRALGWNGVAGSIGTAGAALVAGVLADLVSWRAAFIVPGAVCFATGLAFVAAVRLGLISEAVEDRAPTPPATAADMKRAFAALALTVLCTGVIYQATSYALPKIFEERLSSLLGGSVLGVGGLVTVCYLVSGAAQLVGGELADRYPLKTVYLWIQLAQVPVYAVGFALVGPALVPVAALMLSLNVLSQPTENSLLARYTPAAWRGQVYGAKFVLTLGVGSAAVALIPVIHAATGNLDAIFLVLLAAAALAFLGALTLPSSVPRQVVLAPDPAGAD